MASRKQCASSLAAALLVALSATPAFARDRSEQDEPATAKDWQVDFTPYIWAVNIDGTIGAGPASGTFGVGLIQLLENLSAMAMADLGVRYKRVGILADGMWARVETSDLSPGLVGFNRVDLQLDLALGTGAAFYRLAPSEKLALDPYIGARWWRVSSDLMLANSVLPPPPFRGQSVLTFADPVFGLRIGYEITDRWAFRVLGDVGGGVSRVSWQALVGGSYRFTSWFALDLAYRVIGVDYDRDGDRFEVKLNGLVTGFSFRF